MVFPRTSIVLAAGLGTRFLPTTKSVPKELLPLVDTPCIEYIAEEAAQAGAERLLIVTNPNKVAVIDYFSPHPALEKTLTAAGKTSLITKVQKAAGLIDVTMVDQLDPKGLAHAIACTESHCGDDDAIAVLLPDDIILPFGILEKMSAVREKFGGTVLCAFLAPDESLSAYGVFEVENTMQFPGEDFTVAKVKGMVEKPALGSAPSNFAAAGRYILDKEIFSAIKQISPGAGGEYQLTDAIDYLIQQGHPVHVVVHEGVRHDTGIPLGYIKANVDFALERKDIAEPLRNWLLDRLQH